MWTWCRVRVARKADADTEVGQGETSGDGAAKALVRVDLVDGMAGMAGGWAWAAGSEAGSEAVTERWQVRQRSMTCSEQRGVAPEIRGS